MTTPRLQAPALLDRALARQQSRVSGMVRRGVVVAVNNLYRPAVVDVELEARIGAPSLVRGLSLVDRIFDLAPDVTNTPPVGAHVLCLFPSGRPDLGGFVLGLAPVAQIILSNLANRNMGVVEVSRLGLYQVDVSIPAAGAERVLRIDGLEVALAGGVNCEPAIVVAGAVTFRPRGRLIDLSAAGPTEGGIGWGLPRLAFHGAFEAHIGAGQSYTLQLSFEGRQRRAGADYAWWPHVTASADQTPAPADAGAMLASASAYPLLTLYGALG